MPKLLSIVRAKPGSGERFESKVVEEIPDGESEGDKALADLEKNWTVRNLLKHCKSKSMTPEAARLLVRGGFPADRVLAAWLYCGEERKLESDYVDEQDMFEDVRVMLAHHGYALEDLVWSERPLYARDVSKWLDDMAHDIVLPE